MERQARVPEGRWTAESLARAIAGRTRAVNRLLARYELEAHAVIDTGRERLTLEIDEVHVHRGALYITARYTTWEEAMQDAYTLTRSGRPAKPLHHTDKPRLLIRLHPLDEVHITRSRWPA